MEKCKAKKGMCNCEKAASVVAVVLVLAAAYKFLV
jgi:hypothetical protein